VIGPKEQVGEDRTLLLPDEMGMPRSAEVGAFTARVGVLLKEH
jgi:hypothetical protein